MNPVLPWHHSLWQQLSYCWQQQRLAHALLLAGPLGMGKTLFAQRLANLLLCEQSSRSSGNSVVQVNWQPCERCQACHLFQVGSHPDWLLLQPGSADKLITVERVRELIQFCSLTTYYGRYRVVLISPAEQMNHYAANSLLKLLEEPPPQTLFILVSHQPQQLLITLRSRCQLLDFSRPQQHLTQTWLQQRLATSQPTVSKADITLLLKLSTHAPLAALALVETGAMTQRNALFDSLIQLATQQIDPIKVVTQWSRWEAKQILPWLLSWTMDIIRCALTGQTQYLLNQDYQTNLVLFSQQVDEKNLFSFLDQQTEVYHLIRTNTPVKTTGLLESIAIAWVNLTNLPRRSSV
jgi:DNA polymerase-3 subunit delta'